MFARLTPMCQFTHLSETVTMHLQTLSTLGVGAFTVAAWFGWGRLLHRLVRQERTPSPVFDASAGCVLLLAIGGWLSWAHLATRSVLLGMTATGTVLAFLALRDLREYSRAWLAWMRAGQRWHGMVLALVVARVVLQLVSTANVRLAWYNPLDDCHAYIPQIERMLQTGSLGNDPFSERRLSGLGGQTFLQALALAGVKDPPWRVLDLGLCYALFVFAITDLSRALGLPLSRALFPAFAAAFVLPPSWNLTAHFSAALLLTYLFHVLKFAEATTVSMRTGILLGMICGALATLKATHAPVPLLTVGLFLSLLFLRGSVSLRAMMRSVTGLGCGILVVLLPWMAQMWTSSGTFFYPFLGKGLHGSQYGLEYFGTWNVESTMHALRELSSMSPVVGLFVLGPVCVLYFLLRERKLINHAALLSLVTSAAVVACMTGWQLRSIGGGARYALPYVWPTWVIVLITAAGSRRWLWASTWTYRSVQGLMLLPLACHVWTHKWELRRMLECQVNPPEQADRWMSRTADSNRRAQEKTPVGTPILMHTSYNGGVAFARNPILLCDWPGGSSYSPGMPLEGPSETLADYLIAHGVRFVLYSYGDRSNINREDHLACSTGSSVRVWAHQQCVYAVRFQVMLESLSQNYPELDRYDDGQDLLLDLGQFKAGRRSGHGTCPKTN